MKNKYFQVLNSGEAGTGKIRIYGLIQDWYDSVNARDFIAAFDALKTTCNRINIHINSPGGSVWDGLPIANAIKSSEVEVHTYVDGIAFSMAAIIALSAPVGRVHMAKGSLLMIHSASQFSFGNAERLRKDADDLEKYDDTLASFVEDRTGKTLDEVKVAYFDGEDYFFTASEAKSENLIDHIESYEATDMPENVGLIPLNAVAAWYQGNVNNPKISNNKNSMFNKFGKLSDLAKVAVNDRTPEQIEEVNNQIQKAGVEGVTLVADEDLQAHDHKVNQLEAENTRLTGEITDKDNRISQLEARVNDLEDKPANTPAAPKKAKDDFPAGNGEEKDQDEFSSPTDKWARGILQDQ